METSEQQLPAGSVGAADELPRDPVRATDIEPTVGRGGNVVAVMPPSAAYLRPALAGLSPRTEGDGLQILILASHTMLNSVEHVLAGVWRDAAGTILAARTADPAKNLLRQQRVTALITTPDTALALLGHASLPLDSAPTILLAWPETWDDDEALVGLMQDLPTEAQRILYTAEPARAEHLVERYLRKALVIGAPRHGASPPVVDQPITVASTSGIDVGIAVRQVLDLLQPATPVVWTATVETESAVRQALAKTPHQVPLTRGGVAPAEVIVAADLPQPEDLVRLTHAAGRLVVVTPTEGLPYLARHSSAMGTLRLPGAVEEVDRSLAKQRSRIEGLLQAGGSDLDRAIHTLVPLFEHHDPARVAAALYRLWTTESQAKPEPGPSPAPAPPPGRGRQIGRGPSTSKVFVTAGKKDGATPADFVAMLTRDLKVPREHIGKIDLRETFSLIELPAAEAQAVAEALSGRTIRRRKVVARLDRPR